MCKIQKITCSLHLHHRQTIKGNKKKNELKDQFSLLSFVHCILYYTPGIQTSAFLICASFQVSMTVLNVGLFQETYAIYRAIYLSMISILEAIWNCTGVKIDQAFSVCPSWNFRTFSVACHFLCSHVNYINNLKAHKPHMNRKTPFNLQQNNFNFISFRFTWIPYNKNTAEFWSVSVILFFLWLIIIINTNRNTSYTINTALSKGLESITRHHSPLTTEYISFQHIYKSYSERERKRETTEVGD